MVSTMRGILHAMISSSSGFAKLIRGTSSQIFQKSYERSPNISQTIPRIILIKRDLNGHVAQLVRP